MTKNPHRENVGGVEARLREERDALQAKLDAGKGFRWKLSDKLILLTIWLVVICLIASAAFGSLACETGLYGVGWRVSLAGVGCSGLGGFLTAIVYEDIEKQREEWLAKHGDDTE